MATKTTPGLESIDRLEEKIKLLVSTIGRLKGEHARLSEENGRLQREVETLQARAAQAGPLAEAEATQEVTRKQTELAQLEAARKEQELVATTVRPATLCGFGWRRLGSCF